LLLISAFIHPALVVLGFLFASTVALERVTESKAFTNLGAIRVLVFGASTAVIILFGAVVKWPGIALRLKSLAPGPPGLIRFIGAAGTPLDMKIAALFSWLILAFLYFDCFRNRAGKWTYLVSAMLAMPLWPAHDATLFGLGGRLAGLFIFLALPLIVCILRDIGEGSKVFAWVQAKPTVPLLALATILAISVAPVRLSCYSELLMSNDYPQYEKIVTALSTDNISMLIAQRGLDFYYTYTLHRDAFHFDPDPNWNRAEIWRVAARVTPEEITYYFPSSCAWGVQAKTIANTGDLLVREDCWEQFRARVNANDNPDLFAEVWEDAENPSHSRPVFLRARHQGATEKAFPTFSGRYD
jgi:hypothetical protein